MPPLDADTEQYSLGLTAEWLYLANLLLAPGIAACILLLLAIKHRAMIHSIGKQHLFETLSATLWAGLLLLVVTLSTLLLFGFESITGWMIVILYFTTCHSIFILLGILGLSKAMAKQPFHYPLVGRLFRHA